MTFDPHIALQGVLDQLNTIILGKDTVTKLALTCLLANGHLLIEDRPGVGKTTLAHALAQTLGLQFQRIQFTSDMLPADILGVSIFDREQHRFTFHPGPIFSELLLADEINRATPRTQSALLEAMEERQVTLEGTTSPLPSPFFVIATQNPSSQTGTFPLPESQLDRFLMCIEMGYPDSTAERQLLSGQGRQTHSINAIMTAEQLRDVQQHVDTLHVSDAIIDYIQQLLTYTRDCGYYLTGLSPRAGLGLVAAARAWAMLEHRHYVLPEDIQAVFPALATHRLQGRTAQAESLCPEDILSHIAIP